MNPSTDKIAVPHTAPIVGRLAPSPTGAQHVGNARTYLLAWLHARSQGGRVILRIEDIDSPRVKPGAAEQAMDDLRWLGLRWDEGPDQPGEHAPYVQTERIDRYRALLDDLKQRDLVYPCTCTRKDVETAASAPHLDGEPPPYAGTCRQRTPKDALALSAETFVWRLRTTDRQQSLVDLYRGAAMLNVAEQLGDFVVAKGSGTPAYQLAVVADDHAMEVTQVIRGDDLLPSAFRQLLLYEHFRWSPPEFGHLPLVVGPDGRRLAKRHGDTRLSWLRSQGMRAERLLGWLAYQSKLIDNLQSISAAELLDHYKPDHLCRIPKTPLVLHPSDVDWLIQSH